MSLVDDMTIRQISIHGWDDSPEEEHEKNPLQENIWNRHVRIHWKQPSLYYRLSISRYPGNSNSWVMCDLTQILADWDASSNVYVSKFDKNEPIK